MIDLDLLERIVSSKHLVNIVFIIAVITLWRAYRQEIKSRMRLHEKIERLLNARNRAVEKLLREQIHDHDENHTGDTQGTP